MYHMRYEYLSSAGVIGDSPRSLPGKVFDLKPAELEIPESVIQLVPESVAREHLILPLLIEGDMLHCAAGNEGDIAKMDKLRFILNRDICFHAQPEKEIVEWINRLYGQIEGESADSILQEFTDTAIDFSEAVSEALSENGETSAPKTFGLTAVRRNSSNQSGELAASTNHGGKSFGANNAQKTVSRGKQGMFHYTIEEGQRVLVRNHNGTSDIAIGPQRIWSLRKQFQPLVRHTAHPGQYLLVRFRNGTQEHIKGPIDLWRDPRIHSEIELKEGLALAGKEAVVVYGETSDGTTSRRIFNGPGLFVPQPGEWLHKFSWHASKGGSNGVEKKPNGLQFHKLWLMPDQMYHDVRDVRTSDDAVLVVRLMIFFELLDIEKMLDTTHDPIGDFINAATSDVVEFTGKLTFEDFKLRTNQLNEITTYNQLLHRAEQSGYKINNVVYRGYSAPASLQRMHDEAIQARTKLQLENATERQSQDLEDYRLNCQIERAQRRRSEQSTEVEHDLAMERLRYEAKLSKERQQREFLRQQKGMESELAAELQRERDAQTRSHLHGLKEMGVDLTEYLTQNRADQVIEVRGKGTTSPHLHLDRSQNGAQPTK